MHRIKYTSYNNIVAILSTFSQTVLIRRIHKSRDHMSDWSDWMETEQFATVVPVFTHGPYIGTASMAYIKVLPHEENESI